MKMFVFSSPKPFSRTSARIAFTPSRLVIAGLYRVGWFIRQVAQCDQ
jgi:hypothetical protein